jgi:hypothetical protein
VVGFENIPGCEQNAENVSDFGLNFRAIPKTRRRISQSHYTGSGKKTSRISNGSYKQINKDTEKIFLFVNNKYDAILHYLVLKIMSGKCRPPLLTH